MKKSKKSNKPEDHKSPEEAKKPYEHGERPKHKPQGREHQVHQEILARRLRGGPKPTAQHYARALEQWKNLPGSIVRPSTDIASPSQDGTSEAEGDSSATENKGKL